ncbi:sensor histidine kinase [Microbacterium sp.]|uniref:sensor histidine kinase n=1 Tax=Microbacterium sp. TaxID=51671 RepID=UPI003A9150F4
MPPPPSGPLVLDRTRGRVTVLNQLLLAGVVLVLTPLAAAGPFDGDLGLFAAGVLVIFAITAAVLVIPWDRIAKGWIALVPAADILAIALLRIAGPASGVSLLWIFPAVWLATSFGIWGMAAGAAATIVLFAVVIVIDPEHRVGYLTFLLPFVILVLTVTAYLTARRAAAQRSMLDKQAQLLAAALERARRQEQELAEVLDAVDFGVVRISADGSTAVVNDANARLQRLPGQARGSAAPVYEDDGVTPLPADQRPLARALRGEAFDGQLVWFGDPAGERRALSVTARRLADTAGKDAGAVVVSRDVTSELSALHAREELVASVSHELRTPLTSILGYLDLVMDDLALPAGARHNVEIAERNAERLLAIIGDILAESRRPHSLSAPLSIVPVSVDAVQIAAAAVESLLPRAAERSIALRAESAGPVLVRADPARLRQVIDNLIANAITYNHDGGTVVVSAARTAHEATVAVVDTGIGVDAAETEKIFRPFYRATAVRRAGVYGTGLGLAICRQIVRAHGGDITVAAGEHGGTAFTVRLPIAGDEPE